MQQNVWVLLLQISFFLSELLKLRISSPPLAQTNSCSLPSCL